VPVDLVPTKAMRAVAERGLRLAAEGYAGDGLEDATRQRARKIVAGDELAAAHVRRMFSFFERHAGGRGDAPASEITPWDVAWALWGGDPGRVWSSRKVDELERAGL
jgi:hypothetical protein